MIIKNDQDVIEAQKKIMELQHILLEARNTSKDPAAYESIAKSFLMGIKNIEEEIHKYLSAKSAPVILID